MLTQSSSGSLEQVAISKWRLQVVVRIVTPCMLNFVMTEIDMQAE